MYPKCQVAFGKIIQEGTTSQSLSLNLQIYSTRCTVVWFVSQNELFSTCTSRRRQPQYSFCHSRRHVSHTRCFFFLLLLFFLFGISTSENPRYRKRTQAHIPGQHICQLYNYQYVALPKANKQTKSAPPQQQQQQQKRKLSNQSLFRRQLLNTVHSLTLFQHDVLSKFYRVLSMCYCVCFGIL